jgi:hypothetical protein
MFFGIIIYLYFFDNQEHHLPHLHAEYGETEGIFLINDAEWIEGDLPAKQRKLVTAGLKLTRKNSWQIGNLSFPDVVYLKLTHLSEMTNG